jgi:hypothetical protein
LRPKVAALGIVGGAVVCLPMVQVLRYQSAEIQAAQTERAALDPMASAVALQRGLLAHRDLAGAVLRGRLEFEPRRKLRQGEVDTRLAELGGTLAQGQWDQARQESQALAEDWKRLARQVEERSIAAPQSDLAHRLCVEQTLQVIDLVTLALAPALDGGPPGLRLAAAAAAAMPRLAAQLALLAAAESRRDDAALQRGRAAAETQLNRALGRLDAGLAAHPDPALAEAGAAVGAATRHYLQILGSDAADPQAAGLAALRAQFQLQALAREQIAKALDQRVADAQQARSTFSAAMAALMLALCLLAWSLLGGLRRQARVPPVPPGSDTTPPEGSAHGAEAGRLLRRLRQPDNSPAAVDEAVVHGAPQPPRD